MLLLRQLWSSYLLFAMLDICSCQDEEDERPPGFGGEICVGPGCCHARDDEFGRQFACAMYVYLDGDPTLQMEGCAKHGGGCLSVCQGEIYDLLSKEYRYCDQTYDKDVVVADWYGCFFEGLSSGLVNGISYSYLEKIPAVNVTEAFCDLFIQPGCPMCIALRIPGSPCSISIVAEMCPRHCQACLCAPPAASAFNANQLSCDKPTEKKGQSGNYDFGDKCSMTCPEKTSSASDITCVDGFWNGTTGDASCMRDCEVTGITLPKNGTSLSLAGYESDDDEEAEEEPGCDYLRHKERCALNCEIGTTASAWWECYDGSLRSTVPPHEPLCLENCGEPTLPPKSEAFGNCTNEVLEDPDFEFNWADLFGEFNWSGWNDTNRSANFSNLNGTALREALEEEGISDFMAETCKALKIDNDERPEGEKDTRWDWRRLKALNPEKVNPKKMEALESTKYYVSKKSLKQSAQPVRRVRRRRLAENNGTNDSNSSNNSNDSNSTDDDDGIFVPANTPHGSVCELRCITPFTPDGKARCWNNTWTMPTCIVQLIPDDVRWPIAGRSIVSPLGSLYMDYNLDVVTPSEVNAIDGGKKVTVCAKEGIGCPTGQCFAAVPVEDGGRVNTESNQLRVRFGHNYEELFKKQRFGCEYEVTIPQGTVVAVVERGVGNDEVKWSFRLDPPPPRMMALEIEPKYSSVYVQVKYNAIGTVKCRAVPRGNRPSLLDMENQLSFFVQANENEYAKGEINELEERTEYSLFCRGTGTAGISQSMVNVYDNMKEFTTKTKIPYIYNMKVVKLGHREVKLSILMSGECDVYCIAHQQEDGSFDPGKMENQVFSVEPKGFVSEPIEYSLPDLVPDMPTQIFCRAKSKGKVKKRMVDFYQPLSDSWEHAILVRTPAMTQTQLASLTASGCTLQPPYSPSRSVYACLLPDGRLLAGSSSAAITLDAKVPDGESTQYSSLNCDGVSKVSCSKQFQVDSSNKVWKIDVKAQGGNIAQIIVVMMREADVVPKQIIPTMFTAISGTQNMTICAQAKSTVLPLLQMDKTSAQLLPGANASDQTQRSWEVPITHIKTGSDLPGCTCSECNVEIKATLRGAGKDLILVIFVDGIPSFTLEQSLRVHFEPPVITDANPPEPPIYEDTKLKVYGKNFGRNDTGTAIKVVRCPTCPPVELPAASWCRDSPVLIVDVAKQSSVDKDSGEQPVDTSWVAGEFTGRYVLTDRNKYIMAPDKFVTLTSAHEKLFRNQSMTKMLDGGDKFAEALEVKQHAPKVVYDWILDTIGMCCYQIIYAIGYKKATRTLHLQISTKEVKPPRRRRGQAPTPPPDTGRNLPGLQVVGKVWQFNTRVNSGSMGQFRMHSAGTDMLQEKGWVVKYRRLPPKPGPPPAPPPPERRLKALADFSVPKADFFGLGNLRQRFEEYGAMVTASETGTDGRALEAVEGEACTRNSDCYSGKCVQKKCQACKIEDNETRDEKCELTCDEGTDKDHAVSSFLESINMGWIPKSLRTCKMVLGMMADICGAMRFICQCSCKDYDSTPLQIPLEVHIACERCGDGVVVGWESCDDGNTLDGDGCSRTCEVEMNWDCSSGKCINLKGAEEKDDRNLCGPTTWVDDSTIVCELSGESIAPLSLSVEVNGQASPLSQTWIQYKTPEVRSMLVAISQVITGDANQWTSILEFKGGQRIVLSGRSFPPTEQDGQNHRLTMLIGKTILCAGVEVRSSTEFECPSAMPILMDKVMPDPEVVVRVGDVTSPAKRLSALGLKIRQPEIYSMYPSEFNDTETKIVFLRGKYLGTRESVSRDAGDIHITVGGVPCKVYNNIWYDEEIMCSIWYIPVGSYSVKAKLGNIPAISIANVTSVPTYCHAGEKRVKVTSDDCAPCGKGTAQPESTPDFFCPKCTNAMYQNDTGTTECNHCEDHTFSVPDRSSKEHCRCIAGFYHKYSDAGLAEECTKCEYDRGFGWSTNNWTLDCADCAEKYTKPPQEWNDFGNCPASCYGSQCHPCPAGAVCFGNAAWPRALPGFWAVNIFEKNAGGIERCMPMEACLGDDGLGKMICNIGYEGIRCGVCELGYYKDQHRCLECPKNQWIFAMIFMLFFCGVLVFVVIPAQLLFMRRLLGIDCDLPLIWRCWFMCFCCCRKKQKKDDDLPKQVIVGVNGEEGQAKMPAKARAIRSCRNCLYYCFPIARVQDWDNRLMKAPLLRTLGMCLNFGHTCYAFAMLQRPAVDWPGPSWELLSWTKLLTVDVEFMKPDCVVQMPYFQKWVGKFFMPFGLIVLIWLVTMYLRRGLKKQGLSKEQRIKEGRPTVWQVFRFSLALVIHVILIWHLKVALSPVDCNWCREGVTCLDEYTLVECWSDDPTWIKMMIISVCDFIFVSGFFPIFLTCTLIRGWRNTAQKEDKSVPKFRGKVKTRQLDFTAFFVTGYRGREDGGYFFTYAWEVVVLFRKLALIVSAKFNSTDPVRGANLQLLILLVSLVMQFTMRPYQASILCNIDNFLCVMLFVSLLSACQLTMGGLGDMEICYVVLNIAALFGGAITAICVCLRKLMHAYMIETQQKAARLTEASSNSEYTLSEQPSVASSRFAATDATDADDEGECKEQDLPGEGDAAKSGEEEVLETDKVSIEKVDKPDSSADEIDHEDHNTVSDRGSCREMEGSVKNEVFL